MDTINVRDAKTQLSRLINRVEKGEEILIAKAGRPVAKLVPVNDSRRKRIPGRDVGKVWISDDFDAPLLEGILHNFEE